jgi:hypothetical protein
MHHSRVYTEEEDAHRRSPLKTLILAIIILAALSLAVWAGLHFYQRGMNQKAPGTGRRFSSQPLLAVHWDHRLTMKQTGAESLLATKEVEHDFIG